MIDINFLHPGVLWIIPVLILGLLVWRFRARKRFLAFTAVSWLKRLRHRPSIVRRLPLAFGVLAFAAVTVALTDPVVPFSQTQVRSLGLDIVLVLDLSSSMQEIMGGSSMPVVTLASTDVTGRRRPAGRTRLDTTKEALRDFIGRRRDDRIGLIVFSDNAYLVSPLTFDYRSLTQYVDIVDDQILRGEGMTAIGDGIALANFLLHRQSTSERRNKVIVVFTDGEHNFGRDPIEVLAESEAAAIRVHVIGVDIEREVQEKPAVQRLIQTVREYGGQYFDAGTAAALTRANSEINSLEKGSLTSMDLVRNTPVFKWPAMAAILLLAIALSFRAIPYFSDFT
jgi:Ca-activated chloride channel family protein